MRLYRLLIVDDERLDREGLQEQIVWETLSIDTVMTAKNGFEAIKLMESFTPDILITDIKMPGMSGLVLAEQAMGSLPSLKVIFASGYDDFEYVRSALKMDAFEYILKPIDTLELHTAVEKAVGLLSREAREQEEKQRLIERVNESAPLLKKKFWRELLLNRQGKSLPYEEYAQYGLKSEGGSHRVLLCELDDFKALNPESGNEPDDNTARILENLLPALKSEGCSVATVCLEPGRHLLILSMEQPLLTDQEEELSRQIARSILEKIREETGYSMTIGAGLAVEKPEDLHLSYEEALKAINQKMFVGKGSVLFYYPRAASKGVAIDVQSIGNHLMQAIETLDYNKAVFYIDSLFDSIKAGNVYDRRYVQNCCFNLISRIEITLADMNERLESIFGKSESLLWEKLFHIETILDIRQWLKNVFRAVIEYLENKRVGKNKKIVETVQTYITDHYREELTLRQVASTLFYSPNHLGFLFKEQTGKSFTEYLTEYRMNKAAEHLKSSHMKTYEIANRIGYRNISSFINQFKLCYGMTPSEYRERRS